MEGLAEIITDFFNSIDPKRTLHRSGSTAKPPLGATACEYRVVSQSEVLVPLTRL